MPDGMFYRYINSGTLWAFIVSSLICSTAASQTNEIRIETNLVAVPVTVLDRSGRYITDLKKSDFQLFENDVEQEISFFEPVEKPVSVFLVMDVSGSMLDKADVLANAATEFLNNLRPDDMVAAATFNETVDMLFNFTPAREAWKRKKLKLRVDGLPPVTMVYDAMETALRKMRKVKGRKAIVFFSDAVGSGISATANSTLREAEEGESVIYTIQFGAFEKPLKNTNVKKFNEMISTASGYMAGLANRTGGRHYQIETIDNLKENFQLILRELGQQYSLGFQPKADGKKGEKRRIKVLVNRSGLVVKARDGYLIN
jgi:Ca-activated chloride channel homolog